MGGGNIISILYCYRVKIVVPTLTRNGVGGVGKESTWLTNSKNKLQTHYNHYYLSYIHLTMTLPKITNKQQEILQLLYKYRFLNRIQIQTLMGHKDKKTINMWLRDLRAKHYVEWIYSTHFAEKTKPAMYFIGLNGVRWLKQQTYTSDAGQECYRYLPEEVRKRYRDHERSDAFVARSTLLAECVIAFSKKSTENTRYTWCMQADFLDPEHEYHFLTEGDLKSQLGPQLCVRKQEGTKITNFLLEVFDENLPRMRMGKRLKQYTTFLTEGDWEAERDKDPLPIALLVCPRTTDLIYAKRRTRGLLADLWDEDKGNVHMRFTTKDKLKALGATGKIWEEI
jgi:hypothetical protein